MGIRDPAFQWEAEVLHSARRPAPPRIDPGGTIEEAGDWLTLREASEATGVPTSTIRKWARHDNIPSFLERTSDGYLRVVSMRGIRKWTDEIGRDLPEDGEATAETPPVDPVREETKPEVPEGSMLVPLDAWNRMLNQLGNLHEAGQQLAEARERAAKAETESLFLKERLADLRVQLEEANQARRPDHSEAIVAEEIAQVSPSSVVRTLYRGWRNRRKRR